MKKNKIYVLAILLLSITFTACENFDFGKEQYKNVVYLLSDVDEFNMYNRAIADLKDEEPDTVFITVGLSGTVGAPKDIQVELTPYYVAGRVDSAIYDSLDKNRLFYQYNKSRYDIDFKNWTNFLPEEYYSFLPENMEGTGTPGSVKLKTTIRQGQSSVTIPVLVKDLYKLSPDSLYFLDYKISNVQGVEEINTNKEDILIPVYWKNAWTNSKNPVSFDMYGDQHTWRQGTQVPVANSERVITGSPLMFPVGKNKVRMAAGIESIDAGGGKTKRQQIDNNSLVVVVNEDNSIDIEPYRGLNVEEVKEDDIFYDMNHTNRFFTDSVKTSVGIPKYYKTFNLHYRYKKSGIVWTYCKVTLRYEYQPNAE